MSAGNFAHPSKALLDAYQQLSTSVLCDAMGHTNCTHSAIRPLVSKSRICGPAFTVRCPPGDNLMCHYATARANAGEVLVVDGNAYTEAALWGSLLSTLAVRRCLGGTIIDGAVRDLDELMEIGYPVYARNTTPRSGSKAQLGEVNIPISCGGLVVYQGDWIVADADSAVVIPRLQLANIAEKARRITTKDSELIAGIERGRTTFELLGLSGLMDN